MKRALFFCLLAFTIASAQKQRLAVLEERLPGAFKKIIERSYLAILDTDPQGASLSFNGVSIDSCPKMPCKLELR